MEGLLGDQGARVRRHETELEWVLAEVANLTQSLSEERLRAQSFERQCAATKVILDQTLAEFSGMRSLVVSLKGSLATIHSQHHAATERMNRDAALRKYKREMLDLSEGSGMVKFHLNQQLDAVRWRVWAPRRISSPPATTPAPRRTRRELTITWRGRV